ncbi:MAG: hypothetical protein ACRDN0_05180 [Trebonia sp.]
MTTPDTATSEAQATAAEVAAPPRDFIVLLPPGWVRIPLDGRERARAIALATAKVASLPEPQRSAVRERLVQMIKAGLRQARQAGGIDILMSLAERNGVPIPASCLVSYVDEGAPIPMDMLADNLATEGGDAKLVTIAGRPAVRYRHMDEPPVTRLDYMMTIPGKSGMLTLAFSTPLEPLAEPLVVLFDAITETLRWVK